MTWRSLRSPRRLQKGGPWSSLLFLRLENGLRQRLSLVLAVAVAYLARIRCILTEQSTAKPREPIFNLPPAIVATVTVLVLVHVVRILLLSDEQDFDFVLAFGFIPARYGSDIAVGSLPGGFAADLWTFFS